MLQLGCIDVAPHNFLRSRAHKKNQQQQKENQSSRLLIVRFSFFINDSVHRDKKQFIFKRIHCNSILRLRLFWVYINILKRLFVGDKMRKLDIIFSSNSDTNTAQELVFLTTVVLMMMNPPHIAIWWDLVTWLQQQFRKAVLHLQA